MRLTNEELRTACISNNWFTCGTNRQYKRLFQLNDKCVSYEMIARVIWFCSDDDTTFEEIYGVVEDMLMNKAIAAAEEAACDAYDSWKAANDY